MTVPDANTETGPMAEGPDGSMGSTHIIAAGPRSVVLDPIVGTHSGRTLGVRGRPAETADLPRGPGPGAPPEDVLRWQAGFHAAVVDAFAAVPDQGPLKLFLPVRGETLASAEAVADGLRARLEACGVLPAAVVPQLDGRTIPGDILDDDGETRPSGVEGLGAALAVLRSVSGRIALSDFGASPVGCALAPLIRSDLVMLGAVFARGAAADRHHRLVLNALIDMVHALGGQVIVGGVASARAYRLCREAGADYVQGPFAGAPVADPARLPRDHAEIREVGARDQRATPNDSALIAAQAVALDPLVLGTPMERVFEQFRHNKDYSFLPVVDAAGEPVGIVRETDLKEYTYSLYGRDLLSNRALGRRLDGFVVEAPVMTVDTRAEKILEMFSAVSGAECVLVTRDRQYVGFLSAASLLKVINEKNLALARDQNPLSRLPGNTMINEYIISALRETDSACFMAYLDFDNFKPFNDTYGYRQGDRAITLFADLMRKGLTGGETFIGHVGGDDFFAGFRGPTRAEVEALVGDLVERFRVDVESFYDEDARRAGCIVARDRHGEERCMPLLSVSAALVELPAGHDLCSGDELAELIAHLKKQAKVSPTKIAVARAG